MGFIGTVGSWFLMRHVGRRALYLWGLSVQCILLLIVGGLGTMSSNNTGAQWGIGSLLLVYTFVYDFTVGPVCYSLVSEIPSTRLKIKTVVLARNFYNMGGKNRTSARYHHGADSNFRYHQQCAHAQHAR